MKNVLYCTTRQWNPGDEFILSGCINILNAVIGEHNPIIYNRNPDIRQDEDASYLRLQHKSRPAGISSTYFRTDFWDNSIKFDTDCSFADLAVFAGSPEWCSKRCLNFYKHIIENQLPTLFIGLGSNSSHIEPCVYEVLEKSNFISFRDEKFIKDERFKKLKLCALPCPALQCVKLGEEKHIKQVKTIGLGFAVNPQNGTIHNCVSDQTFEFIKSFYKEFIKRYKKLYKINIICHYIDEVPYAEQFFKGCGVDVLYSYDSKDYIDIYKKCDCVLTPRVHGCGISSSLGIPSMVIYHDERSSTTEHFLSQKIQMSDDYINLFKSFESFVKIAPKQNKILIAHKKKIFNLYVKLIKRDLSLQKVKYSDYHFVSDKDYAKKMIKEYMFLPKIKYKFYSALMKITFGNLKNKYVQKRQKYNFN